MAEEAWVPKTDLGKKVLAGSVTSIKEIMDKGLPILETRIIDRLLPGLDSEILDINRVQRRDRSGRKMRYRVVVVLGNRKGYVGIGQGKAREVYGSIQKATQDAKKSVISVRRGCGSWECGCGRPHTVPFRAVGKSGSVEVTLMPAPRGVDLAAGDVAKTILQLAGIEDVWSRVKGNTQNTLNFAMATFDALKKTNAVQATPEDLECLGVSVEELEVVVEPPRPPETEQAEKEPIEEAVSEEAVSEEAVSEEAVSEEAVSEEAVSEEAVSEEA
jgi:small subunit ribosomal protein S5